MSNGFWMRRSRRRSGGGSAGTRRCELDLPFALWSRAAVRELVARRCGVALAVRTTGKYLARWGFTAQKPLRRAYEQDPAPELPLPRRGYPATAARASVQGRGGLSAARNGLRA